MKDTQEYKLPFEKLQVWHLSKDFAKRRQVLEASAKINALRRTQLGRG